MLVEIWLILFVIGSATMHQTLTRQLPAILGAMFGILIFSVISQSIKLSDLKNA